MEIDIDSRYPREVVITFGFKRRYSFCYWEDSEVFLPRYLNDAVKCR